MRRVVGAWLLFLIIAGPRVVHMARDPLPAMSTPASETDGAAAPGETEAATQSVPTRQNVPRDYRSNPLTYFSTAPPDSLRLLPGIGPVLAARIVDARSGKGSFTRWSDLQEIKGIGPRTVERLRALAAQ